MWLEIVKDKIKIIKKKKIKMSEYTNELIRIGYFIGLSFILAFILLGAVYIISFTSKVDFEKSSAYECGFNLSLRLIIIWSTICINAILFLLFDMKSYFYILFVQVF